MEFKLLELATQTGKARVIPQLVRGAQKFIVTIATFCAKTPWWCEHFTL